MGTWRASEVHRAQQLRNLSTMESLGALSRAILSPKTHALLAHHIRTTKTAACPVLTLHTHRHAAKASCEPSQAAALLLYIVSITLPRA